MTAPALAPYIDRARALQAILTLQKRIGDRQGEIETRAALAEVMWAAIEAGLIPCLACGGDLTVGSTHYSWRDAAWRCLAESEVSL